MGDRVPFDSISSKVSRTNGLKWVGARDTCVSKKGNVIIILHSCFSFILRYPTNLPPIEAWLVFEVQKRRTKFLVLIIAILRGQNFHSSSALC